MSTATATRPVSPAQSALVRRLLDEVLDEGTREAYRLVLNTARENGNLDGHLVSTVIDRLLAEEKIASERQVNYLTDLLADREVDFDGNVAALSRSEASALITLAKAAPKRQAVDSNLPRHGYYAVEVEGDLRFLRVSTSGKVFRIAGPAEYPTSVASARADLDRVLADPRAAAIRYGQEIGSCGRCGRRLTDENSRSVGLGPVCESKGW